jgi:hypothetical protein
MITSFGLLLLLSIFCGLNYYYFASFLSYYIIILLLMRNGTCKALQESRYEKEVARAYASKPVFESENDACRSAIIIQHTENNNTVLE